MNLSDNAASNPCTAISFLPNSKKYGEHLLTAFGPWLEIRRLPDKLATPLSTGNALPLPISNMSVTTNERKDGQERIKSKRYLAFGKKHKNVVHGINFIEDLCAVFGGMKLTFFNIVQDADNRSHHSEEVSVDLQRSTSVFLMSDWIWDVRLRKSNVNSEGEEVIAAVGLAHNMVELWRVPIAKKYSRKGAKVPQVPTRLSQIVCDVRCITYCMAFYGWDENHGESADILSIAVGTVSNKILIWDVPVRDDLNMRECECPSTAVATSNYSLEGHKGVIFCIRWIGDGRKMICSSSDDRSVRLWRLSEEHIENYECIWIGWGHTARVWDVQCCMRESGSLLLISSSEDGCIRFWSPIDDKNEAGNAVVGKEASPSAVIPSDTSSIWRIARHPVYPLLAAGGNDGSMKYWDFYGFFTNNCEMIDIGGAVETLQIPLDLRAFTNIKSNVIAESSVNDDGDNPPKKKNKKAKQIICGVAVVRDSILIATRAGSLFSYNLPERNWSTLSPWYDLESQQHSNVVGECMAVHSTFEFLAIGCTGGEVIFTGLNENATHSTILTSRSYCGVKDLHWIDDNHLLACHIKGIVTWIFVDSNNFPREVTPVVLRALDMKTKGVPIAFTYIKNRQQLFVGDTRGNVAVFEKIENVSANVVECSAQVIRAHGRDHVNCITSLSDSCLLSGGADGCLVEFHVEQGNPSSIKKALSSSVRNFTSITKIWSYRSSDHGKVHTIIGGFYGNVFKVHDLTTQRQLSSVVCGGRSNRLMVSTLAPFYITAFVGKTNSVGVNDLHVHSSLFSQPQLAIEDEQKVDSFCFENSVGLSFQGDTTNSVSIFRSLEPGRLFLLAGGNDCSTKVIDLHYSNKKLKVSEVKNLPMSESCARATSCSTSPHSRCHLLASCGGKLSMQFYRLQDDQESLLQQDGMQCCFVGATRQPKCADIDQRINAVDTCHLNDSFHVVLAGDSDGGLYLLIVDDQKQYPKPIPSKLICSGIDKRPILCVQLLKISNSFIAVLGNTGGEVQIWNLGKVPADSIAEYSPPTCPIHTYKPHTMGTNSVCIMPLINSGENRQILIATGGDDQSLSLCNFQINLPADRSDHDEFQSILSCTIQKLIILERASSSSIKSVKLNMNGSDCLLYSVGYDANLCVWKVLLPGANVDNAGSREIRVSLIDNTQVEISDVSSMDIVSAHSESSFECFCSVVGQGLQIISHIV